MDDGNSGDFKLYYNIREVSELLHMPISQIRYYENQFKNLRVRKDANGNRMFTVDNIETLRQILRLTKDEGYTIEGADKALKNIKIEQAHISAHLEQLIDIKQKLIKLRDCFN
jgi:DNA-binding transcriptional MerR regulator